VTTFDEANPVFVVRIWREPREIEQAPVIWRGVVEHISSGSKLYFENLEEIIRFIEPYVQIIRPGKNRKVDEA
jgi:hypothetical protein